MISLEPWEPLVLAIAAAPNGRARKTALAQMAGLLTPETAASICQEALKSIRTDPERAGRLAKAGWLAARATRHRPSEAESLRVRGHLAYLSGRYHLAISAYRRAIRLLQAFGDVSGIARTQSSALQSLMYLGRDAEAFSWAEQARAAFDSLGDRVRVAHVDSNRANLLHRMGRLDEAMALYRQARNVMEELGDRTNAAIVLRNMAVCAMDLNDHETALHAYEQAGAVYQAEGMTQLLNEVAYNVPYLHYLRGEYTRAIALYQALGTADTSNPNRFHRAVALLDQSDLYLELNLYREAARFAKRALVVFQELGIRYEEAKAATNYGVALVGLGRAQEALESYHSARRLFLRTGTRQWAAAVDLYRSYVLEAQGSRPAARAACRRAERVLAPTGLTGKSALAALLLGKLALSEGDLPVASAWCVRGTERAEHSRSRALQFQAWQLKAQILEAQNDIASAIAAYETAHQHLARLRRSLQHDELKIAFLRDKSDMYEALVDLLLRTNGTDAERHAALGYSQQAKSRGLADLLSVRAQSEPRGPQAAVAQHPQVAVLRRELAWTYHQVDRVEGRPESDRNTAHSLRHRMAGLEEELAEALNVWRKADPDYVELQGVAGMPVEQLLDSIQDDEAIFEYMEARGSLHLFILRRTGLQNVPLGPMAPVRAACRRLRFQLNRPVLTSDSGRFAAWNEATSAHLKTLYDHLIKPAEALLPEHLIVAPHRDLHGIPFQAMNDGHTSLLDRCAVSYALSSTVHALCGVRKDGTTGPALVLGVPDSRAPQIEQEARQIAALLPDATLFLGEDATVERLRHHSTTASLLHLATHGLFREDNPLFSSMLLGDARLCLFDLYDLDLGASLVTLSGCFTGLGGMSGRDEFIGMTRGLLSAGARAVHVATGQIHDESTTRYMLSFYRKLTTGHSILRSSHEAMLEVRRDYPHPYFWSLFQIMGQVT